MNGTSSQSHAPVVPVGDTDTEETSRVKDGTPTDEELEELADKIVENWKKLGRRLNVTDSKLLEIGQAHNQLSGKGYYMLKHWKQEKGSTATYQALSGALKQRLLRRQDLAEQFCYINGPSASQLSAGHLREERVTGDQCLVLLQVYIVEFQPNKIKTIPLKRKEI